MRIVLLGDSITQGIGVDGSQYITMTIFTPMIKVMISLHKN